MAISPEQHALVYQLLRNTTSADPTVQQANSALFESFREWPCAVQALAMYLSDAQQPLMIRQTAAILLKQLLRGPPTTPAVSALLSNDDFFSTVLQPALLSSLADSNRLIQTSIASVISQILTLKSLAGWPTLLPSLVELAGRAELQSSLGVVRCLRIVLEDSSHEVGKLCEDPMQLSVLCGVIESITRRAAVGDAAELMRACLETLSACFSSGVMPQSSHLFEEDDSDDDDALLLQGTSPTRCRGQQSTTLSRGMRRLNRQRCLQRVKVFVDVAIDAIRFSLSQKWAFDGCSLNNNAAFELIVVELSVFLVGFWDRSYLFFSDFLPLLLDSLAVGVQGGANRSTGDVTGSWSVNVAVVDLITELAQNHEASALIEKSMSSIVAALLQCSVIEYSEGIDSFGGEQNYMDPDAENQVLPLVSHRQSQHFSKLAKEGNDQNDESDERGITDDEDYYEEMVQTGESEGSKRDSIAWCWNCIAAAFPEELTTAVIPVLAQASVDALSLSDAMKYEAVLFSLGELVDEIFVFIPQPVVHAFLDQCAKVLQREGQWEQVGSIATVRRQAVRCLERSAVGYLSSVERRAFHSNDFGDGSSDTSNSHFPSEFAEVDLKAVAALLLQCVSDTNKSVQLAAIRGLENIVVHALPDDDDDDGSKDTSPAEYLIDCSLLAFIYNLLPQALQSPSFQLRSRVALLQLYNRIMKRDMATLQVISPSHPLGIGSSFFELLLQRINSQLRAAWSGATCELLTVMNVLCTGVEAIGPGVLPFVDAVWASMSDFVTAVVANNWLSLDGRISTLAFIALEETATLAIDIVSSCCDALLDACEDNDSVLQERRNKLCHLFVNEAPASNDGGAGRSTLVASCFQILERHYASLDAKDFSSVADPSLRRACFALLGDFVSSGAAESFPFEAVSDVLMTVCCREVFLLSSTSSQGGDERWFGMDAKSNALFCMAHLLLEHIDGDISMVERYFPCSLMRNMEGVCFSVQSQIMKDAVDNVHRTMKLNLLYVASCLASLAPSLFVGPLQTASGGGVAGSRLAAFIDNASYYIPFVVDGEELLNIMLGLGRFLQIVSKDAAEMAVLTATPTATGLIRIAASMFAKSVGSHFSPQERMSNPRAGEVVATWQGIATALMAADSTIAQSVTRQLTKKEQQQLKCLLST